MIKKETKEKYDKYCLNLSEGWGDMDNFEQEILQSLKLKELIESEIKEFRTSNLGESYKLTPRGYGARLEKIYNQSKNG